MKFTSFLGEDMSAIKSDFSLKKSSITDPHIQRTIKLYASAKGISTKEAQDKFKSMLDAKVKNLGVSTINKNAVENAAESVAFQFLQELDPKKLDLEEFGIDDPADLLDRDFFFDLTEYVLGENAQFFPLKNPFEKKAVRPYFFITPDHLPLMKDEQLKDAAANHCQTAFCTPNAEMVFNRNFSEQLALSALINNAKPKSKKYKSNGGPIPDHYCYLEFVVMHELLHFSSGDHFYTKPMVKRIQKKYPQAAGRAHQILNYVGDFINNWQLAKSGYEQLPIGLFSSDVNYDKFNSYEEIIDAVVKDLIKINDEDFEKMSNEMEKGMDEHMDNPDDKPSQGGSESEPMSKEESDNKQSGQQGQQGQQQDQQGQDGQQQDGQDGQQRQDGQDGQQSKDKQSQSGKPSKPSGQPDDDGEPSADSGDDDSSSMSSAIDDAMKKNQERVQKRDDGNNDAKTALETKDDDAKDIDIKRKAGAGTAKIEFKEEAVTINWKKVLKRLIPTDEGELEDTYSKMSRQATSSMVTAKQTGAGRISPGEVKTDAVKKGLVFVIDNSGSVMSVVNQFNQEIMQLLKKNKQFLDNMYIIKFSNKFELNKINISKLKYQEIQNPNALVNGSEKLRFGSEHSIVDLFSKSYGLGTEYTPEMHRVIEYLHSENMNVIMFTDDDLVQDKRAEKFFRLNKARRNSIALFITDARSHANMEKAFGQHKWMTVLK